MSEAEETLREMGSEGSYWIIQFEDADRDIEVFTDEISARKRYAQCQLSWNCRLFKQITDCCGKETKPKIVTLCGSSRFCHIMAVCAWMIERDEQAITMGLHLLPDWYCRGEIPDHLAEHEGVADAMDKLHLAKIDISDEVFVVNVQHYVGDSTRREVEYAMGKGKKMRWFTDDIIGRQVEQKVAEAVQ